MCSYKDIYSSIAGLSTTENRQSDMVANKIKCRTTRGMSWSHLTSITSGLSKQICLQDSSDHSLTLLSKTGPYISASWGGYLLDMSLLLPDGEKISSSSNTTGGLFNSVPQSMSSKRAKPASRLFFWKKGENYVDFGVSIVSLHQTSEGSSEFYWAYGWYFDFDCVLLTLMLTPAIFLQKGFWHIRPVCAICTLFPSHYQTLCPKIPLTFEG